MIPIRAVLLDFDGVIAHTEPHMFGALWSFFGFKNIRIQKSEWDRSGFAAKSIRQIVDYLNESYGYTIDFDEMIAHIDEQQAKSMSAGLETDPSLLVFFRYCQDNHIQLAIGSNSRANRVIRILGIMGISQYFLGDTLGIHDHLNIIGAEDLSYHKPDPEVWIRSAERLNVPLSECLVIEDGLPGLLGAKACGARSIYYHHFRHPDKECLKNANYGISDFSQVIDFIESHNVLTK
ncbi:MAG: HAD family phosphatase [Candidatus Gracilibacteria bacterium]